MSRAASNGQAEPPDRPVDWAAVQYQPAPGTPLLACACGASYLDDDPGRSAHHVVFGHQPEASGRGR
jgi:hypothetical protein